MLLHMDQRDIRRDLTIIALINLNEDYNNALEDPNISKEEREFLIACIQEITLYLDELKSQLNSEEPIKKPLWSQK